MDPAPRTSAPELTEILARAGIQPEAVGDLMTWAYARSSALLAALDPNSALGQSLAPGLAQLVMRRPSAAAVGATPPPPPVTIAAAPVSVPAVNPAIVEAAPADESESAALDALAPVDATAEATTPEAPSDSLVAAAPITADDEVPLARPPAPSRGTPRAVARVITKPYLGAAVEAALQTGDSEAESPPAPLFAEDDPTIGGFARLAFSVRRPSHTSERPSDTKAPLAHGFAMHAERVAAEASQFTDVPAPPSFETSESNTRMRAFGISGDSERSTSLVVGIPDDEGADVPLPRQRSRSGGLEASPSGSLRAARPISEPASVAPPTMSPATSSAEHSIGINLAIEDPELSSALHRMIPQGGETSSTLTQMPTTILFRAGESQQQPVAASSEMSLQIPITIEESTSETDGPETSMTAEVAEEIEPPPDPEPRTPRKSPPPPPQKRGATVSAKVVPQPEPPQQQSSKRGRGRKKVVELGAPVARPAPRAATPAPAQSRPSRAETPKPEPSQATVPNYLRDDDE